MPALKPPSLAAWYSSFVPTMISGFLSPVMSATAGVSMIAPWLRGSSLPWLSGSGLNVGAFVTGSIAVIFDLSTTVTGKPGTSVPLESHA